MDDLRDSVRSGYDDIPVPKELGPSLELILRRAPVKKPLVWERLALCAATLLISLIIVLNTVPSFALAASELPVLGTLCRVFTFRHSSIHDEHKVIDVTVPKLKGTGNGTLEDRVNLEIARLMDDAVEDATERAEEYYEAYVSTGGDPAEYHAMEVTLSYEIKSITEERVSFMIYQFETLASAYANDFYYNLDLKTGRDLTLRDLLGNDYVRIVSEQIEAQLTALSPDLAFYLFDDISIPAAINENRKFYLNENGQIVVVFDKYELAAGAAGQLEFVIEPGAVPPAIPSVIKVVDTWGLQGVLLNAMRTHTQPPLIDISACDLGPDPVAMTKQLFAELQQLRPEGCTADSVESVYDPVGKTLKCTLSYPS